MPIIILMGRGAPSTPRQRTFDGLLTTVTVQRAFSGLGVRVRTERLRGLSGLYARVTTQDPNALPLPGDASGYVVTHRGLPQEAVSYTVNLREGEAAPRLEATLRGQVMLEGNVSITVQAGPHRQTYGPFGALGVTFRQTPTGWVTQVTSADMSAADAEADSPYMEAFTEEILPWERERDLTPYEQARKARADALAQQEARERQTARERALTRELERATSPAVREALRLELCRVRNQTKPPLDRRRVPVQGVIRHALNALPFPFRLPKPLPYAGDFFWASDNTGLDFAGGKLIGVSFQVKGKTAVQVLEELLGPIGWQVVIRGGEAYIGPPETPEESAATPGHLDLPGDALTAVSIEQVNPEATQGNGNRQLPRRITVTGASARKWLPPLPPEKDDEGNLTDPADFSLWDNATLTGSSRVVGYSVLGEQRLESETRWSKTKEGGVLVREHSVTNGMVPHFGLGQVNGQWVVQAERWTEREVRETVYSYDHPTYPKAMTSQLTTVDGYAEPLNRNIRLETTRITQEWHGEGWLRLKTTTKETIGDWQTYESEDGKTRMTYGTLTQESETEEWTPLGPEQWKHVVTRTRRSWWPMFEDGESTDPQRRTRTEVLVDDLTDQGPPRAPEDGRDEVAKDCGQKEEEGEGFPYDEPLERVLEPGGRGEAVTRSIPWATSIPDVWLEDVVGSIRRARPVKRTKYELAAPPKVEVGTRIKDFSLSGSAASVRATVTVEEALDVQGDD